MFEITRRAYLGNDVLVFNVIRLLVISFFLPLLDYKLLKVTAIKKINIEIVVSLV